MTTIATLNACEAAGFVEALRGIYEHSPWIAARAAPARPFASLAALKRALQSVVDAASIDEQLVLLRAHPELAGKAAIAGALTAESTSEQASSGLDRCTPTEYAQLHALNADYNGRFGFPFILRSRAPLARACRARPSSPPSSGASAMRAATSCAKRCARCTASPRSG